MAQWPSASELQDRIRQQNIAAMPGALKNILLLGMGAGAGYAGLRRLVRLNREQDQSEVGAGSSVRPIKIYKNANMLTDAPARVISSIGDFLADAAKGKNITSMPQHPLFLPGAALAGAGGAYAGFQGVESVLKSLRAKAQQERLQRARQEYEAAIMPQPAAGTKAASQRGNLAMAFDRVIASLDRQGVKTADAAKDLSRATGLLMGLYLTAGLGAAAYGAHKGYKQQQADSKVKALQRAQKERNNSQVAYTPTAITVDMP